MNGLELKVEKSLDEKEVKEIVSENGSKLYKALEDKKIQQIAFEKYGFRTGITGGNYDVSSIGIGIPKSITSTVTSLKMDVYNQLIDYLKQ